MTQEEEMILIRRCVDGDPDAFEPLVTANQSHVYSLALRILGNEADASDAAQDAFIKAYTSLKDFRGNSRFSSWLYRITHNICLDYLRRKKRAEIVPLQSENEDGEEMEIVLPDERYSPELLLEQKEQALALERAWKKLPEDARRILSLREMGGLSYEEIAEELQLELGTVRSRLNRARKKLCVLLAEDRNFSPPSASE